MTKVEKEEIIVELQAQKERYKKIRENTHCIVTETSDCDRCVADHLLEARLETVNDIIGIIRHMS